MTHQIILTVEDDQYPTPEEHREILEEIAQDAAETYAKKVGGIMEYEIEEI